MPLALTRGRGIHNPTSYCHSRRLLTEIHPYASCSLSPPRERVGVRGNERAWIEKLMGQESNMKEWSWREESNLQPAVYKTAALPLSYASLTSIVAR